MYPLRLTHGWHPWVALLAMCVPIGCASPRTETPAQVIRPAPPSFVLQTIDPAPDSLGVHVSLATASLIPDLEPVVHTAPARALPISMETVFRLAADRNGQVAIGREKLNEVLANQEIAARRWLPDITGGTSYARHEGGIQDFYGNLINSSYGSLFAGVEVRGKLDLREATYRKIEAERQVWQQKGELSKLTAENLLDATTTYIEFLAARTGQAIAGDMEQKLGDLLIVAEKLAGVDEGFKLEVSRVKSELQAQRQITRKLRESGNSAAAKLAYLLGLSAGSELVPMERSLPELNRRFLVDPHYPAEALVEQALANGPGVRELSGLVQIIDDARSQALLAPYVPTLEVTAAEGLFGAGPDAYLSFTNRFDLGVNLRWNLTEAVNTRARRREADAKIQQAQLGLQDLRAKLALGVQEAREASLSNADMMHMGEQQIESAEDAYKRSDYRLRNNLKGASPSEVLQSLRAYIGARLTYLNAVRELDKSQLRLFVLMGAAR